MTSDSFALWKFKTIDGILENCKPFDFTTSIIHVNDSYKLTYDVPSLTCKIECLTKLHWTPIETSFKDLPDTLKKLSVYKERTTNRHTSSYLPFHGSLEK